MGAAIVCDDMTGVPEFGFETSAMLTSSVRRRIKRSLLKMKKEVERRSQREVGSSNRKSRQNSRVDQPTNHGKI